MNFIHLEEDYLMLFGELTKDELTKKEVKQFKILKEIESLIEEAKSSNDNAIKIRKLKEALSLNEETHEALFLLGQIFKELDSFQEAILYIDKALLIKPEVLAYQFEKALCLSYLKKRKKSEKMCLEIISINPRHFASLHLGNINLHTGKYENAIKYYLKFIEVLPDHYAGYNSISNTYRVMGKLEKAFEYIYKALEISPQSSYSNTTLAEIYLQKDNLQEFYKNLQLAFSFGLKSKEFQRIIKEENVYRKVYNDKRFLSILNNYRIKVELPE